MREVGIAIKRDEERRLSPPPKNDALSRLYRLPNAKVKVGLGFCLTLSSLLFESKQGI